MDISRRQPIPVVPEQDPQGNAVTGSVARHAIAAASPEYVATPESPEEQIAQRVCRELLTDLPGYQGTFSFGTPGGNDLDLRLCFADMDRISQEDIREQLLQRLHHEGVRVDVDLLFMTGQEFVEGIRDLVELGDIADRLRDGFDPHIEQAAVGDTSMFSLYIFSTMRALDRNPAVGDFGSPQSALDRLTLTRDGAVGWMHFYTGCFLHEYLKERPDDTTITKYEERLAKFTSRVVSGSTLAQLELPQLAAIQPEYIAAIRRADQDHSTDANMSDVLLQNPNTAVLLDVESSDLLRVTGGIRNNPDMARPADFISLAEARLFYEAFQQGIDLRAKPGEYTDPLTIYALGELIRELGDLVSYEPGAQLMAQGEYGTQIMYIPLKKADKTDNGSVDITVRNNSDKPDLAFVRRDGVLGEGAILDLRRSATVTAKEPLEAYVIDASKIIAMLTDPDLHEQLQQPLLTTRAARRLDAYLRYSAIRAGIFTRETLEHTSLAPRESIQAALGDIPFAQYNLGQEFHNTLALLAGMAEDSSTSPITSIHADTEDIRLFEAGQPNDQLYVVSEGTVVIPLENGETVTLQPGEFFGESSILGLRTTGTAILSQNGRVLSVNAQWFKRFTQSRRPIQGTDVLPVHLLYHLAAEGYDRLRRRLSTQRHNE